jgi:hypothetical protein
MLGLILVYFVGKAFYDLAGKYHKHQWGFGVLGVVSYYAGFLGGSFILGMVAEIIAPGEIENTSDLLLTIIAVAIGVGSCWGTYAYLKRTWSTPPDTGGRTLDSGLIVNEDNRYDKDER